MVFGNNEPFDEQPLNDDFSQDTTQESRLIEEVFGFRVNRVNEEVDEGPCDHEERVVEKIQSGGGGGGFGFNAHATDTSLVTACPICNTAWTMDVKDTGNGGSFSGF